MLEILSREALHNILCEPKEDTHTADFCELRPLFSLEENASLCYIVCGMGQTRRTQIKFKQKIKKKKRREKLAKNGKNPDEYFYNGFYVRR